MNYWGVHSLLRLLLTAATVRAIAAGQSGGPYEVVADTTSWSLSVGPSASAHVLALSVVGEAGPQGVSSAGTTTLASGFLGVRPVPDTDGDGIPDDQDADADLDGIPNTEDAYVYDTDNDGQHNYADSDDDGDVLSDSEELGWGTDPLLADSDGDGFDDGTEVRVLRTSPADAADTLQFGEISIQLGAMILSWPTKPMVQYYIQRLSSFRTGTWEDVAGPFVGTGGWLSVTNSVPGPMYFYRVRVGP